MELDIDLGIQPQSLSLQSFFRQDNQVSTQQNSPISILDFDLNFNVGVPHAAQSTNPEEAFNPYTRFDSDYSSSELVTFNLS